VLPGSVANSLLPKTSWIRTPKAHQAQLKEDIREVYEATDLISARMVKDRLMHEYEKKLPKQCTSGCGFRRYHSCNDVAAEISERLRTTNGVEWSATIKVESESRGYAILKYKYKESDRR